MHGTFEFESSLILENLFFGVCENFLFEVCEINNQEILTSTEFTGFAYYLSFQLKIYSGSIKVRALPLAAWLT